MMRTTRFFVFKHTKISYAILKKTTNAVATSKKPHMDEFKLMENIKMQERIDKEMAEFVRKREENIKKVHSSVIYQAFMKEFGTIEDEIWTKFHLSGVPLTPENISYVRQQVDIKRDQLKRKYEHMARVYKQRNMNPNKYSQRDIEELEKLLNDKDLTSSHFAGIKKMFAEYSGVTESELEKEISKDDIQEFFKMIRGPDGLKIKKALDNILTDDKLKEIGIDPNLYNPELVDKELDKYMETKAPQQDKETNLRNVEKLKELVRNEIKNRPELADMITKTLGYTVEELLNNREQDIQEGKFEQFMQREDLTDVIYKLNNERLQK
jgi:hypothetical protein